MVLVSRRQLPRFRRAGRVAAETLRVVGDRLRAGLSTAELDRWVREDTRGRGATPSQLGYHGFPAAVCTSRNEVVCHGIPRPEVVLLDGDILNVDVTSELGGWHGDTSATFCIGAVSPEARHLVETAERCLWAGIRAVRPGGQLGDIGAAIFELASVEGCDVVREWGGHGIGRRMHLAPHVSHVGERGTGLRLVPGMAFTIEPMITLGSAETRVLPDGWTVVTCDGKWSAQFEHTIVVSDEGCEVLTALP